MSDEGRIDESYDASDPLAINLARKKYARRTAGRLQVIKAMMEHAHGRKYIYQMLEFCHIFEPSFDRDALVMAFREGERNIGNKLLADVMEAAPDMYTKMCSEGKTDRE